MHTDFYGTIDDPWFPASGQSVSRAAEIAFGLAGVTRDDIDVAGLYDCFTITMLRDLEELGFCKLGEGADYFREGHTRLGGDMPANTDGGLLSNSHNGMPTGCTRSRWSASCAASAAPARSPRPRSASPWPRAMPSTAWRHPRSWPCRSPDQAR